MPYSFLPTSEGRVVILMNEEEEVCSENKKEWEGEEGAWSPGNMAWAVM